MNLRQGISMPKYEVRLEFDVVSTDFADVTVEATSAEEAKAKAISLYIDSGDFDYYSSHYICTTLSDNVDAWECTKLS